MAYHCDFIYIRGTMVRFTGGLLLFTALSTAAPSQHNEPSNRAQQVLRSSTVGQTDKSRKLQGRFLHITGNLRDGHTDLTRAGLTSMQTFTLIHSISPVQIPKATTHAMQAKENTAQATLELRLRIVTHPSLSSMRHSNGSKGI